MGDVDEVGRYFLIDNLCGEKLWKERKHVER